MHKKEWNQSPFWIVVGYSGTKNCCRILGSRTGLAKMTHIIVCNYEPMKVKATPSIFIITLRLNNSVLQKVCVIFQRTSTQQCQCFLAVLWLCIGIFWRYCRVFASTYLHFFVFLRIWILKILCLKDFETKFCSFMCNFSFVNRYITSLLRTLLLWLCTKTAANSFLCGRDLKIALLV